MENENTTQAATETDAAQQFLDGVEAFGRHMRTTIAAANREDMTRCLMESYALIACALSSFRVDPFGRAEQLMLSMLANDAAPKDGLSLRSRCGRVVAGLDVFMDSLPKGSKERAIAAAEDLDRGEVPSGNA